MIFDQRERGIWDLLPPPYPTGAAAYDREVHDHEDREDHETRDDVLSTTDRPPGKDTPTVTHKNDYSLHFVNTGQRPHNSIRDSEYRTGFDEYPRLNQLIRLKDEVVQATATPPMYIRCDLKTTDLATTLGSKFDVILIDPPWEEYVRRCPGIKRDSWSIPEIANLKIETISENPSFVFLWVGSSEGLDVGRMLLRKWGYRRCEDIIWVKTNRQDSASTKQIHALTSTEHNVFQHTKEHCLMGIKGTVRRSQDGHLINANIDTDIIISEEPLHGSTAKPQEFYSIIEHFSLGRRRLELFGTDQNIRRGWVTLGKEISCSNFDRAQYLRFFQTPPQFTASYNRTLYGTLLSGGGGGTTAADDDDSLKQFAHLTGSTLEIESLRPKSPPPQNK